MSGSIQRVVTNSSLIPRKPTGIGLQYFLYCHGNVITPDCPIGTWFNLSLKIERGEKIDEGLRTMVKGIKRGDLPMYFFILLPTAFFISIGIVENQLKED
jgi:hypothetical protein